MSDVLIKSFMADCFAGVRSWRLWNKLAWHDLIARYRRSWLGPIWLVLTVGVFVAALSFVYGTLFGQPIIDYLPFVAIGVVCWTFISTVTSEAAFTFVEAETYIRQSQINLFIFVFRVLWRNVLVFVHQFLVVIIVLLVFDKFSPVLVPIAIIGLLLMFAQGIWVIPLLGLLGTRFRDLNPILINALQFMFFVTPVIWMPAALGAHRWIADINPLHSLISVVRHPLLGTLPRAYDYAFILAILVGGIVLTAMFYGRFGKRVVYWL